MSKTPPNRRGITFEVGAALEARDNLKNWYAANIEKIDYEDEKVLIHYRQWSHRYDEWFDWASPYLRPVERVQLRRERLQEDSFIPGFNVNDKVLASWSDCRFYPAKVLAVNKDASYTVKFYDGVIQTVKGLHVKPFIKEKRKKLADRNDEKHQVKKAEKDKKKPENGASRGKQTSLSPAEQADRGSVEEEDDISDWDGDGEEQKNSGISDRNTGHKNSQLHEVEYLSVKKENEEVERVLEEIGQHNYSKSFLMKDSGHEEREQEATVKMEVDSVVLHSCMNFSEGTIRGSETEDAEVQAELAKEDIKNLPHNRKSQRKRMRGKRRISMSKRRCPLKKSKTVSNSDGFHSDSEAAPALTNQRTQKIGLEPAASLLTLPSNGTTMLKAQSQSETPKPTAVRKQSFHNPNRFSREPLYRVIKNQPPPVLSINLDHNPFKCSAPGCTKSFRKAKLLHYHMKYYHGVDCPIEEDLCPSKDNQNRAVDKQAPLINQDGAKRRCTTSVSMYSTSANIIEKRRSSAPPVVSVQNYQQWPSLKEKTKENQLCSNTLKGSNKEKERRANVKEHDRLKEKQSKDFLHIQLSKNKKKKSMSDEDSISDWSSDSCGWSEDDMEMDLDIITSPLSSSSVASTTGSREIVRCVCEVEEENDFMLQCEACRYWQHGTCMGLLEENVPERYACFICRDSPVLIRGQRQSLRDWYDTDWFSSGHMYGLSFLENYSHQNAKKIAATHQLLGDVQRVVEVLSGLQLKISVLQSQAHPDLKLWCQPWKLPETFSMKSTALQDSEASLQKEPLSSSFQDYISSEHCYQKPHALHPRLEPRLMVKTRVESGLEDRVRTETLLKNKQHCSGEIQSALSKTLRSQFSDHSKGVGEELGVDADGGGVKETQNQQWRINLLEHIESVQEEVTHRMDFIERELDVLENWLDCTGELEPPEPLDRLPELKHNIKQLLNELDKVQQIALVCAT